MDLAAGRTTGLRCLMLEKVKDSLLNVITKPVGLGLSVSPDGK